MYCTVEQINTRFPKLKKIIKKEQNAGFLEWKVAVIHLGHDKKAS